MSLKKNQIDNCINDQIMHIDSLPLKICDTDSFVHGFFLNVNYWHNYDMFSYI